MTIDYKARRQQFAHQLPSHGIAVIPAGSERLRTGDSHYRFCQDSDFYYLTGFNEPDALLIITSGAQGESVLFNRPRMPAEEQWTGARLGQEDALAILKLDRAFPIASLEEKLPELLMGKSVIYYPLGRYPRIEKQLFDAWQKVKGRVRGGVIAPQSFVDLVPLLGEMRLIKSKEEQQLMREAARISIAGHQRAMRACRHAQFEYELEAEFIYEITRQGCRSTAYDSIVAGGANGCVLHYTANNQPLVPGELVLMDAGGELDHYAADITRTYPVNGRFSEEQRLIYALVMSAQQAGIACVKPGAAWNSIQEAVVRVLTTGLVDLGLLRGSVDGLIEQGAYKSLYMHSSGHWLGLDVHDVGAYTLDGSWRPLAPGMVLTVEPGLYISEGMAGIDSRWWGIGVRIEDDILVTKTGHENLTEALPVAVDAIEEWLRG
jgi:Xaa-Pro aminopeptidase